MNKLSTEERARVIAALVEGNSIRATVRLTGIAKNTVTKLLVDVGAACEAYQKKALRGLRCRRVQCDEIWSFVGCKQKNVRPGQEWLDRGDAWTFTAIDADTKLVPCWLVGKRDLAHATAFMEDLAGRLANRVLLTTDGHKMYLTAVPDAFYGQGQGVDYAQLVKIYGNEVQRDRVRVVLDLL